MKPNRMLLAMFLAASLTACGTGTLAPTETTVVATPATTVLNSAQAQRAVFTAKSTYAGLLTAAVTYKELRRCSATVPMPCSDAAIVSQLQKADTVASVALDAAEAAVRTPQVGSNAVTAALATANSALAALSALVSTLGVK